VRVGRTPAGKGIEFCLLRSATRDCFERNHNLLPDLLGGQGPSFRRVREDMSPQLLDKGDTVSFVSPKIYDKNNVVVQISWLHNCNTVENSQRETGKKIRKMDMITTTCISHKVSPPKFSSKLGPCLGSRRIVG